MIRNYLVLRVFFVCGLPTPLPQSLIVPSFSSFLGLLTLAICRIFTCIHMSHIHIEVCPPVEESEMRLSQSTPNRSSPFHQQPPATRRALVSTAFCTTSTTSKYAQETYKTYTGPRVPLVSLMNIIARAGSQRSAQPAMLQFSFRDLFHQVQLHYPKLVDTVVRLLFNCFLYALLSTYTKQTLVS